jgi:hypothetical protein
MGIIHFRALYALLRMLPAYNLHRRLRRANNGLKLGLKLWAPEGYPNTEAGLQEAWEIMEQDLVGLDTGLRSLVSSDIEPDQGNRRYDFPSLELFGNEYSLSVDYRPEVDIQMEDLESVLSEKFVDMEEDWFTPTVARHRMGEGSLPSSTASSNPPSIRVATPTAIPYSNPAPIPQRQGPASIGSFQSGQQGLGISRNRQSSAQSQSQKAEPVGTERWAGIGEGLPFATGSTQDGTRVSSAMFDTDGGGADQTGTITYSIRRCGGCSSTIRPLDSSFHISFSLHFQPTRLAILHSRPQPDISASTEYRPFILDRKDQFFPLSIRSIIHPCPISTHAYRLDLSSSYRRHVS